MRAQSVSSSPGRVTLCVGRSSGRAIQRLYVSIASLHTIGVPSLIERRGISALDYPYVTTLLPNGTVEIHSVESQAIVQVISAPPEGPSPLSEDRKALIACMNGFFIPSTQRTEKLRPTSVRLLRGRGAPRPETSAKRDEDADNIPDIPAL